MADLKLPKLPDRTPVKITISVMPELAESLKAYADAYEAAYGRRESVSDLMPFMLLRFLESVARSRVRVQGQDNEKEREKPGIPAKQHQLFRGTRNPPNQRARAGCGQANGHQANEAL